MKLLVMCLAMVLGVKANAFPKTMTCTDPDPNSNVELTFTYDVDGAGDDLTYSPLSPLTVSGIPTDDTNSSSSSGSRDRFFKPEQIVASGHNGWFQIVAHSTAGSTIEIHHHDGSEKTLVEIDFKEVYTPHADAFYSKFVTKCSYVKGY